MESVVHKFAAVGVSEWISWVSICEQISLLEKYLTSLEYSFFLFNQDYVDRPTQLALSVLVIMSFAIIFAFCELGAQVTHQFNSLDDVLCQVKWYILPIEVQRMVIMFMLDAQQAVFLRGYGNIVCSRDSFKNVWSLKLNSNLMHNLVVFRILIRFFLIPLHLDNQFWVFLFYDSSPNQRLNGVFIFDSFVINNKSSRFQCIDKWMDNKKLFYSIEKKKLWKN